MSEHHPGTCHVCGSPLNALAGANRLCLVTSDCRPWPGRTDLGVCSACGVIQKPTTTAWQIQTDAIYGSYTMYPQGSGSEQASFAADGGKASARSQRIVDAVHELGLLAGHGRMLDIGCGNGKMLHSFHAAYPGWTLSGLEWDDRHAESVYAIGGVTDFHTGFDGLDAGSSDLITMLHVLEHIPAPIAYLERLRVLLDDGGRLLVQVPNLRQNPYDLAIFDHCSHFTPTTLKTVLKRAGFEVEWMSDQVVSKELTVLCRPGEAQTNPCTNDETEFAARALQWLSSFAGRAEAAMEATPLGIFGTSIGASWIVSQLHRHPDFFVDEDPNRIGNRFLDSPILDTEHIPEDAILIIPLTEKVAATVGDRISRPDLKLIYPA